MAFLKSVNRHLQRLLEHTRDTKRSTTTGAPHCSASAQSSDGNSNQKAPLFEVTGWTDPVRSTLLNGTKELQQKAKEQRETASKPKLVKVKKIKYVDFPNNSKQRS